MIRLDCTRSSVVVVCTDCGHWRSMAFTKLGGWERGAAHEQMCHPESTQARDALSTFRKRARHAV